MDRSLIAKRQIKTIRVNKPLGRVNSIQYRKVAKNRSNHLNQTHVQSYSKFIENDKNQLPKAQLQNIKELVKSFKKIEKQSEAPEEKEQKSNRCSSQQDNRAMNHLKMDQKDKKDSKRMDDLETRLQKILEQKLMLIQNNYRLMHNYSTEQLEKDLNELNDCIYKVRSNDEFESQSILIAKKIEIIEKIMAENYSESQLLKKCFQTCRTIRKSSQYPNETVQGVNQKYSTRKKSSAAFFVKSCFFTETTNRHNFQKPSKQSYQKHKINSFNYVPNKQSLPRSSYKQDFLPYGVLPRYTYQTMSKYEKNPLPQNKVSSYQASFQEKKAILENPKELECRTDKIRQLKVTFRPDPEPKQNLLRIPLQLMRCRSKENYDGPSPMKKICKPESRRQFTKKTINIANPVKSKRLNEMKYSLKNGRCV